MKLRGAIGESGKAPGAFDAVRTWSPVAGDEGRPGYSPSQIGNPNLGPERTREVEVGFEASALAGRLGVDFTYYRQRTMDALIPVTYPPSLGFPAAQLENVGELENNGFEVLVNAGLLRTQNVDWRASLNYSRIKSKAVDLGGQEITVLAVARTYIREGYPVPSYFGKKLTNPDAYVTAAPEIVEDQYIGPQYPEEIIGVSTSVTLYDRLTLDILGEAQRGHYMMNALGYQNSAPTRRVWQPCYDAQRALEQNGQVTARDYARCGLSTSFRDYDYWIEPADFFKLRSISLSYDLPEGLIPGTRSATLTLAGRNLFTITDYSGTDPEVSDIGDSAVARRDYYNFPTSRTFTASLRVNF